MMKTLLMAATLSLATTAAFADVKAASYGTTSSGEPVTSYTLTNARGTKLVFIDYGARLTEAWLPDAKGTFANVTRGYPSLAEYEKGDVSIGLCHPGGNADWAKRVWTSRPLHGRDAEGVEMKLVDPADAGGLSGTVRFTVRYWLTADDIWRIESEARTDAPTPLNPARHACFNLSGDFSRPVTNHLLRVNASLSISTAKGDLPTDQIHNHATEPCDYRLTREIGPVPLNVNYVPDMPAGVLRRVAEFADPSSGRTLEVATTLPGLQVCDGGHIGFTACAFAAQYDPTAVNPPAFPDGVVRADEVRCDVTEYRFGVAHPLAFAPPFTDGAILQRELPVAVFGRARAGAAVTVRFAGQSVAGKADADGRWLVHLAALSASKTPRVLSVESEGVVRNVRDVRVGEVWLASGQSNMELPLCSENPRFRDGQGWLVASMTRRNENVRSAYAATYTTSPVPLSDINLTWAPLCPEYLKSHLYVSALTTYFERELFAALDVPVGVIGAYWGGTRIEPWTPDGPWAKLPKATGARPHLRSHTLFNAMFAPLAPYTVRGLIWYQGESNADKAGEYQARLRELRDGFVRCFENPSLKMIFAQLAPCDYANGKPTKRDLVALQDAQTRFADEETNVWMAVTADVGNFVDVHPNDKRTVARRFAALALRHCYGWKDLVADSPRVVSASADGTNVTLRVDHGGMLYSYAADRSPTKGFELRDANGAWRPAVVVNEEKNGVLKGGTIVLSSPGVNRPTAVRYLRTPPFIGTLYGENNLPLGTFEMAVP